VDALSGAGGDTWIDYGSIEDPDLRSWAENKNFPDAQTALKSSRELEKLVGNDRLGLPEEGQDLSEWSGWDKLGVPKEAKEYADKIKLPENLPDGMQIDEGLLGKAMEIAAEKRIPAQHLQEMVNLFAETQAEQFKAAMEVDATDRQGVDQLYEQWGTQKDANLERARRAAKELEFDDDLIGEASQFQGSAKLMKTLANIGKKMSDGGLITGGKAAMSAEQAQAEMDAMKSNPEVAQAIMDPSHARHGVEKARWEKLSALTVQ
jgi:hypothetical protein